MPVTPNDEIEAKAPEGQPEDLGKEQPGNEVAEGGEHPNVVAVAPPQRGAGAVDPPGPPPVVPVTPATPREKIVLAILLAVFSFAVIATWFYVLKQTEERLNKEYKVAWAAPEGFVLRPGPPSFYYNRKEVSHRGPIDTKLKSELLALPTGQEPENTKESIQGYNDAVDNLAYQSNESLQGILMFLLAFGGLSAVLGNQLRANGNFVNIIVYKDALDVRRWWPWYAMHPLISFVLGVIVVLLVKADLIQLGDKVPSGSMWWSAIAFLAGFGASEFTERLRLLTQTLFGKSST